METQTINQAVSRLEAMPKARQQEIFDFIDFIYSRREVLEAKTDSNHKQDFIKFLADWRERNKDILDDEDPWANVRDKQDTGRDFSWND